MKVHFLTIVLNGMPFLRYHPAIFAELPFEWHWHVVEGVAALRHDTAWSLRHGGRIDEAMHREGRSNDGTSEFLDELAQRHPRQVHVYRKPEGTFWDGKLEMVRAPMPHVPVGSLLWQVDADELWTAPAIAAVRGAFQRRPQLRRAHFWCRFHVAPDRVIEGRGGYGNRPRREWFRAWRVLEGEDWISHEPPLRGRPPTWLRSIGQKRLIKFYRRWHGYRFTGTLTHAETAAMGAVFDHLAYVAPSQLEFKERYYGYSGAVRNWNQLREAEGDRLRVDELLPWVDSGTVAVRPAVDEIPPAVAAFIQENFGQ